LEGDGVTPELQKIIRDTAARAVTYWADTTESADDVAQALWQWYLERPSVQRRYEATTTVTKRREMFYRAAMQHLSAEKLQANAFDGRDLYSVYSVKAALVGTSTNRYLLAILPLALDDLERQNSGYREALRSRYDDGVVPRDNPGFKRLQHALSALVAHVNVEFITDQGETPSVQSDPRRPSRGAGGAGHRRVSGSYSDPTADLALGLIKTGDAEVLLEDGSTTTYRKEIMEQGFDNTFGKRPATREMSRPEEGVFDSGFVGQDRADMYRAQVVPELYPNEKPMLIDNWPAEDREAYCGGEFTPGYRRLQLVK
jgi:hypothetical protein